MKAPLHLLTDAGSKAGLSSLGVCCCLSNVSGVRHRGVLGLPYQLTLSTLRHLYFLEYARTHLAGLGVRRDDLLDVLRFPDDSTLPVRDGGLDHLSEFRLGIRRVPWDCAAVAVHHSSTDPGSQRTHDVLQPTDRAGLLCHLHSTGTEADANSSSTQPPNPGHATCHSANQIKADVRRINRHAQESAGPIIPRSAHGIPHVA